MAIDDIVGGVLPKGLKVESQSEDTTINVDVSKAGPVVTVDISASCTITLINAPIGYSEITFIFTGGPTDVDVANVKWIGGSLPSFTASGIDLIKLGIVCTSVDSDGTINGDIFQISEALALAED